ncbi:MAG: hypothetical protein ACXABY_29020 [Candidatus Thorarchaeota archaeon]|jgi:hypothetical protein
MPKYSPIAPLPLLHELQSFGLLSPYLLLLAHDILKHPKGYDKLLDKMSLEYDGEVFIIVDNGVIENGAPCSKEDLIEAAHIVQATCIIAPDVLGQFHETKKLVIEQADFLRQHYPLMYVPQGSSYKELQDCINWYIEKFPAAEFWGVPRWIANHIGSRKPIVEYIAGCASIEAKIHLLGMSENLHDDMKCILLPNVIGIDSANPVVTGQAGIQMQDPAYGHLKRGSYWEDTSLRDESLENVAWMHDVCSHT